MLDRRVYIGDGTNSAQENWAEELAAFCDILGYERYGGVHLSRNRSALVGGHRVVWHVLDRNVVRADEAAPCGSAGS